MWDFMRKELRVNINHCGAVVCWLSGQMQRWNKQWRLRSCFNNSFPSYFNSHHFAYVRPPILPRSINHWTSQMLNVTQTCEEFAYLREKKKRKILHACMQNRIIQNSPSLRTWLTQLSNCVQIRYFLFWYIVSVRANTIWSETQLELCMKYQ